MRGANIGLAIGQRRGDAPQDVTSICSFRLAATAQSAEITGEVVAVPMTPMDLLSDQDTAVYRMHRAIKWSERDGVPVDVVGLGSLCAVVGGRGKALQERVSVPVTTGGAATVWTMFVNAVQANPHREPMGVIGSNSPVGKALVELLDAHHFPLLIDSKRLAKKCSEMVRFVEAEDVSTSTKWIIGCGPTGPVMSESVLQSGTTVLDVALPHSFAPCENKRMDIRTIFAERMSMPRNWHRGLWGRVYHLVSGYGYQTVLACLIEPVIMAGMHRQEPFAQGRSISVDNVQEFGRNAANLGFFPTISSDFWALQRLY